MLCCNLATFRNLLVKTASCDSPFTVLPKTLPSALPCSYCLVVSFSVQMTEAPWVCLKQRDARRLFTSVYPSSYCTYGTLPFIHGFRETLIQLPWWSLARAFLAQAIESSRVLCRLHICFQIYLENQWCNCAETCSSLKSECVRMSDVGHSDAESSCSVLAEVVESLCDTDLLVSLPAPQSSLLFVSWLCRRPLLEWTSLHWTLWPLPHPSSRDTRACGQQRESPCMP